MIRLQKGRTISLGSCCCWCFTVLLWGRGHWVCRLAAFVMISHNRKGIRNMIRRSHLGCAVQPCVWQINIWCSGHFWGVFDDILPVWWDCTGFHIRHSGKIVFKDSVILWNHLPIGRIPHKCHAASVERQVSQLNSNAWAWHPFWWAYASRIIEACI